MAESKGITLAEIKAARAHVDIDLAEYGFEGAAEPLTVWFDPTFWNDGTKAKFSPPKDADPKVTIEQINAEIVAEHASDWNLTDDGKPVKITVKNLRGILGDAVVDGILTEMIKRIHPNRKSS